MTAATQHAQLRSMIQPTFHGYNTSHNAHEAHVGLSKYVFPEHASRDDRSTLRTVGVYGMTKSRAVYGDPVEVSLKPEWGIGTSILVNSETHDIYCLHWQSYLRIYSKHFTGKANHNAHQQDMKVCGVIDGMPYGIVLTTNAYNWKQLVFAAPRGYRLLSLPGFRDAVNIAYFRHPYAVSEYENPERKRWARLNPLNLINYRSAFRKSIDRYVFDDLPIFDSHISWIY